MVFIVVLSLLLCVILWKLFLQPISIYLRAIKTYGKSQVLFIYKPLSRLKILHTEISNKYGNSYAQIFNSLKKNPGIKIIIYQSLGLRFTIVLDQQLIKKFVYEHENHVEKFRLGPFEDDVYQGLLHASGEQWKKQRKILSNIFHFKSLKDYQQIIIDVAKSNLQNLQNKIIDLKKLSTKITGQTLIKSLLGAQFYNIKFGQNNPHEENASILKCLIQQSKKLSYIIRYLIFGCLQRNSFLLTQSEIKVHDRLLKFKQQCKQFTRKEYLKYKKSQKVLPLLKAYFDSVSENLNDQHVEEIVFQIIIFLFAGEDTTSNALINVCYYLAQYPQIQKKLRQQLKQSPNIHQCKNLNNFIYQCLRINTPAITTVPRQVHIPFSLNGFQLKKGEMILIGNGINTRNPKFFLNPDKFDPQRFNQKNENLYSYIPFYVGPRNCIGQHLAMMQIRNFIKQVLRKYRLERTQTQFKMFSLITINGAADTTLVKFVHLNESN